jgi:hypothetical protein
MHRCVMLDNICRVGQCKRAYVLALENLCYNEAYIMKDMDDPQLVCGLIHVVKGS